MLETHRIDAFIYNVLSSDAVLQGYVDSRIYAYGAPADAELPFVVFSLMSARDVRAIGTARIMVDTTYLVRVVGTGTSSTGLVPIVDRVDALLHGASGAVLDGYVLACVREEPVEYVELVNGVSFRHLGGLWKIIAQ